ncbi:uncharacterized protein LOC144666842 [Oculina patagonica]
MFLCRILFSFQIVSFLIPDRVEGSSNSTVSATSGSSFTPNSSATANASNPTMQVSMTTVVTNTSVNLLPTPSSTKISVVPSSVAVLTSPPPSEGEQEAVVLTVAEMTTADFEVKKGVFINSVKKAVKSYCSTRTYTCNELATRKRRGITADQVYIASGYPKQSPFSANDLLVAVFVSTGDNIFLSKNILLNVITEYKGNISSALDRTITGVSRLHFEVATFTPTESDATSGKTKFMYVFFGAFCGAVIIVALCICVACWYGRRSERDNDMSPQTTSTLKHVNRAQPFHNLAGIFLSSLIRVGPRPGS